MQGGGQIPENVWVGGGEMVVVVMVMESCGGGSCGDYDGEGDNGDLWQ